MDNTSGTRYTAKLMDGPLEGKTITVDFLPSGEVQPTVTVPVDPGKSYLYARTDDMEFDTEDSDRPSAVGYRYRTTEYA